MAPCSPFGRSSGIVSAREPMDLHADARIPFPIDVVFAAYRDDMVKLAPYLSNVRSIEVKSRKDSGSVVELVNEWRGGGEVPGPLRAILGESMLAWTDYATWDSATLTCDWRTETAAFKDAMRCRGKNAFIAEGPSATRLEVRGSIEMEPKKIPALPSFVAGGIARAFEKFLVDRIASNLLETASALTKYLSAR
jgi:hypothetical protein